MRRCSPISTRRKAEPSRCRSGPAPCNARLAGVIALVTPALIGQAKQLPALESRAIAFVRALQDASDNAGIPVKLSLPSGTAGISTAVLGSVLGILSGTLGTLINVLLVVVISIYLLIEGRQLIASMRKLFPGREEVYDFTLLALGTTFGQYARGQLTMSLVMGTYTGVAMTLIGVPYAVVQIGRASCRERV